MKNKGFTLAELLGVLVILALIAIITFPAISKSFTSSRIRLCEMQLKEIEAAAKSYAAEHLYILPSQEGESLPVTLATLSSGGYIEKDIKNPVTNQLFELSGENAVSVNITKVGKKYTYQIDNNTKNSCK